MKAQVGIVMGSESDWEVISNVSATFKNSVSLLKIEFSLHTAHPGY